MRKILVCYLKVHKTVCQSRIKTSSLRSDIFSTYFHYTLYTPYSDISPLSLSHYFSPESRCPFHEIFFPPDSM